MCVERLTDQNLETRPRARERDEHYRAFVRASSEGIWCCESDTPIPIDLPEDELIAAIFARGYVSECNDATVRMYGFSRPDELIGTRLTDLLTPDEPGNVEMLRAFVRSGFRLEGAESIEPDRDGDVHYFVNGLIGVVVDGMLERTWGTQRDVTEQKRVENSLRESEQRYRELFESANDIVYTHDMEGHYTSLNRAGERITGYTRDEARSLDFATVVVPEDVELVKAMLAGKRAGERQTTYEITIVGKSGKRLPLELSTQVLCRDGKPVEVLGIARDVSERKRLEEQLRQSQKMEAIGRLAGGVAHDFNNLLTLINGYTDMLLGQLPPESPLHSDANEVRRAGEKAVALTRQLLTFSRQQVVAPKILDLNEIVSDMDRMLRRLIGEDVELEVRLDGQLGRVSADASQLEQVVMNLAVNARDAMPKGGRLTIETLSVHVEDPVPHRTGDLAPARYAMLVVSDTGEGMDEETRHHIFEPFYTTKGEGRGTGLGLATVYGIVKQNGGHVAVESQPDQGATFRVYLPVTEAEATPQAQPHAPATMRRGSETVLLVEDEESVRRLLHASLERCGYAVLCASDGLEALRICEGYEGPIDLMVTDVVMPVMGGVELRDRARTIRPDMRTLFISGYTEHPLEGSPFLPKPFTPMELAETVREILESAEC